MESEAGLSLRAGSAAFNRILTNDATSPIRSLTEGFRCRRQFSIRLDEPSNVGRPSVQT
jgi:hypothetical protein